jgi:hypothetical protein
MTEESEPKNEQLAESMATKSPNIDAPKHIKFPDSAFS